MGAAASSCRLRRVADCMNEAGPWAEVEQDLPRAPVVTIRESNVKRLVLANLSSWRLTTVRVWDVERSCMAKEKRVS